MQPTDVDAQPNECAVPPFAWQHMSEEERAAVKARSKRTLKRLQAEVCSRLSCATCPDVRFTSLQMYDAHMASKRHARRERRAKGVEFACEACGVKVPTEGEWWRHVGGARHERRVQRMAARIETERPPYTMAEALALDAAEAVEEKED